VKNYPWSILQIEPTQNQRDIKKAYARLLKSIDQKENPQAFQVLREAYDAALRHSHNTIETPATTAAELSREIQDNPGTELIDAECVEEESTAAEPQSQIEQYLSLIHQALSEHDENTAIASLKDILQSEHLESIDARYEFEGGLLHLINYLDNLPIEFARNLISTFSWELHDNPFNYDQRFSHAYHYFMTAVERYEAREYVQKHYFNPKLSGFEEVESALFSEFNQKALERISEKPQLRLGAERLLMYTLNQHYSHAINPIDYRTISWWNENVTQLYAPAAPAPSKNSSGNPYWVLIVIFFVIFPAIRTCSNIPKNDHHSTALNSGYYQRYQSRGLDPRVDPRLQFPNVAQSRRTSEPKSYEVINFNEQLEAFLHQRQNPSKQQNYSEQILNETRTRSVNTTLKPPAFKVQPPISSNTAPNNQTLRSTKQKAVAAGLQDSDSSFIQFRTLKNPLGYKPQHQSQAEEDKHLEPSDYLQNTADLFKQQ
jgi:hypothetical protein